MNKIKITSGILSNNNYQIIANVILLTIHVRSTIPMYHTAGNT